MYQPRLESIRRGRNVNVSAAALLRSWNASRPVSRSQITGQRPAVQTAIACTSANRELPSQEIKMMTTWKPDWLFALLEFTFESAIMGRVGTAAKKSRNGTSRG